ncbi:hypothetical protein CDEST_01425 [Colletotrichum destructivum]|uniref:Uncharacterized protein n=1 Tax=Colletotrichum destructivum TaxID=34406 RepID=A0AAX4HZU9_9PEZI|nr:hypothetical protein CDEST_01425 [Colletotrichum destructivum]
MSLSKMGSSQMGKLGLGLSTMSSVDPPPLWVGLVHPPLCFFFFFSGRRSGDIVDYVNEAAVPSQSPPPPPPPPLLPLCLAALATTASKAKQSQAKPRRSSIAIACARLSDATEIQLANSVSPFRRYIAIEWMSNVCHDISCKFVIPPLPPITPFPRPTFSARYDEVEIHAMIIPDEASLSLSLSLSLWRSLDRHVNPLMCRLKSFRTHWSVETLEGDLPPAPPP